MYYYLRLSSTFLCLAIIFMNGAVYAAGSVPVTPEDNLGLGGNERNTCDPEFWDVMKDRAWMEAQREITQNANLIARPDSVLSLSCFDSLMNHISKYSDDNFPGDPQYAEGDLLDGLATELLVVDVEKLLTDADPYAIYLRDEGGVLLNIALEMLVLDQLMDDVTALGKVADGVDLWYCGAHKEYYIDDNFPNILIGDRAKNEPPPLFPAWSELSGNLNNSVSRNSNFNGCAKMNQVWQRSKCYDFATESQIDVTPPATDPLPPSTAITNHDGFYSLKTYRDQAAMGRDYRTLAGSCGPPRTDITPPGINFDLATFTSLACDIGAHDLSFSSVSPSLIATIAAGALIGYNDNPTWNTAYTGSFPNPGTAGALDAYMHLLGLRDTSTCAPPIKTGYVVVRKVGGTVREYVDSVCPTPGCWFNPPSSLTGTGTCSN